MSPRPAAAAALAWIVWVWFSVEFTDLPVFALLLLFLVGGGSLVIGLVLGVWKKRWRTFLTGVAVLFLGLSGLLVGGRIMRWQVDRVAVEVQPMIAALEEFRAEHGRFPAELAELIPAHLPEVPRARIGLFGRKFEYYGRDGSSYHLEFDVGAGIFQFYDSTTRTWRSDGL